MCRFTPVGAFSAPDPAQRKRNRNRRTDRSSRSLARGKLPSVRTFATRSRPSELNFGALRLNKRASAIDWSSQPFRIAVAWVQPVDFVGPSDGIVWPSTCPSLGRCGPQRATYSYDPFGSHATATGVNGLLPANPWRWMGGYLDATGLYHFGERYYEPGMGRFLQVDPIAGGSANAYGYCSGDPMNCSDLSGLFGWRKAFGHVSTALGAVAAGALYLAPVCPMCPVAAKAASFLFDASWWVTTVWWPTPDVAPVSPASRSANPAVSRLGRSQNIA